MQLDPAEKRSVWWKGALKGAAKGLAIGVAVGIASAFLFQGIFALGLFPEAATLFKGFLTLASTTSIAGALVPWSAFSVVPFALFSGGAGFLNGLFTGGSQAVAAYHQNKHNARDEAKIIELDGRTRELEQAVSAPATSRNVQQILEQGPRRVSGFEAAEADHVQVVSGNLIGGHGRS